MHISSDIWIDRETNIEATRGGDVVTVDFDLDGDVTMIFYLRDVETARRAADAFVEAAALHAEKDNANGAETTAD